ncbi:MAG: Cof-type HAD-IIB family hydrolase [Acidimicrobiia bacterium]|nr:Cof-type HAD-IIB family hydrolase [Acidimicrobiia bacterium]
MPRPIELVVTDLDGTFWGPDGRCHPRTLAAVAELERRDIGVLIATGRRRRSCWLGLQANDVVLPAVLLNGCHGWDYRRHEQFHLVCFDADEAHAVIDAALALDISPVIYVDQDDPDCYATSACSTARGHLDALAHHLGDTPDLHHVADAHAVIGFAVLGRPLAEMEALADDLNSNGAGLATTSIDHQYGDASVMVQPTGVTKWAGVTSFCHRHDIAADRVLAVGDAGNDLGMLEAATVAVAVEGSPASVLAAADHVIGPPADGGWAELLTLV